MNQKRWMSFALFLFMVFGSSAQELRVFSPDRKLVVEVELQEGKLYYAVILEGQQLLLKSPLGVRTNISDFTTGLRFLKKAEARIDERYEELKIKKRFVHYLANELICTFENADKRQIEVVFRVSDNNVAFRYGFPQTDEVANYKIDQEFSGFQFPAFTTTFLTPQAPPMTGWKKTKPSYEEEYKVDEPLGTPSKYGIGYTFPCLFRVGEYGWVLLSETGVSSLYAGSKLGESSKDGLYFLSFPEKGENNGLGSSSPYVGLPGQTPWRTITFGRTLKPIVETTLPFDLVKPLYAPSIKYLFGRSTWSWLLWQDGSINFEDQKTFIDLSSKLGYEFTLVDNWWDTKIGREKIEQLVTYGKSKGVGICLWYNSNGFWNEAPQSPKNKMNTSIARKKEMAWMQRIGVKGIKVDFFGGDKQETIKLYEDILSDANDFGLTVIFHGSTLPRGWERMYPNYVGSEAVLASENLIFTQHANDTEAFNATLHPFIRNTVGSMDFGPVLFNKRHNRQNSGGNFRRTTETFQMATSILFQSPVQNFGITPNNLNELPAFVIDFMKKVPTTWDETLFIEGYPGKYVVLARRHEQNWYIAGINADSAVKKITVSLPMLTSGRAKLFTDNKSRTPEQQNIQLGNDKKVTFTIQPQGAVLLMGQ